MLSTEVLSNENQTCRGGKPQPLQVGEDVTVGLAVNQMTEIITYVKGGDNFNRTLILTIGLVAICIVAYMYIFLKMR